MFRAFRINVTRCRYVGSLTLMQRRHVVSSTIVVNTWPELIISGAILLSSSVLLVQQRFVKPFSLTFSSRNWPVVAGRVERCSANDVTELITDTAVNDAVIFNFAYVYNVDGCSLAASRIDFWSQPGGLGGHLGADTSRKAVKEIYLHSIPSKRINSVNWVLRQIHKYPVGSAVQVRYCPQDPTLCTLETIGPDDDEEIFTRTTRAIFLPLLTLGFTLLWCMNEFTSTDYLVVAVLDQIQTYQISKVKKNALVSVEGQVREVAVAPPPLLRTPFSGTQCVKYTAVVEAKRRTPGSTTTAWVPVQLAKEIEAQDFALCDGSGCINVNASPPRWFAAREQNITYSEWTPKALLPKHVVAFCKSHNVDLDQFLKEEDTDGTLRWVEEIIPLGNWVSVIGVCRETNFGDEGLSIAGSAVHDSGGPLAVDQFGRSIRDHWALIVKDMTPREFYQMDAEDVFADPLEKDFARLVSLGINATQQMWGDERDLEEWKKVVPRRVLKDDDNENDLEIAVHWIWKQMIQRLHHLHPLNNVRRITLDLFVDPFVMPWQDAGYLTEAEEANSNDEDLMSHWEADLIHDKAVLWNVGTVFEHDDDAGFHELSDDLSQSRHQRFPKIKSLWLHLQHSHAAVSGEYLQLPLFVDATVDHWMLLSIASKKLVPLPEPLLFNEWSLWTTSASSGGTSAATTTEFEELGESSSVEDNAIQGEGIQLPMMLKLALRTYRRFEVIQPETTQEVTNSNE